MKVRPPHPLGKRPALRRPLQVWRHRGIGPADAILASYPKSGNTWVKFMLLHLLTGHRVDFDRSDEQMPYVGGQRGAPELLPSGGRLIKSHEPFSGLYAGRYRQVIYLVRDGRDVAVSYYHAFRGLGWFDRSFAEFLDAFLAGTLDGYGTWPTHVEGWLDAAAAPGRSFLVLRYEDLLADPNAELGRIAEYLGLDDCGADAIAASVEASSPNRMREAEQGSARQAARVDPDANIVRAARSGDWERQFSDEDTAKFERAAGRTLRRLGYDS